MIDVNDIEYIDVRRINRIENADLFLHPPPHG